MEAVCVSLSLTSVGVNVTLKRWTAADQQQHYVTAMCESRLFLPLSPNTAIIFVRRNPMINKCVSWADSRNSADPVRRCCSSWTGVSICQADSAPSSDNSFCLRIAEVGGASHSERKVLLVFFQPSESRTKRYSDGAFRCCWICLNHCYRNNCSGCNLWCCWNVLYYAGMCFCQP